MNNGEIKYLDRQTGNIITEAVMGDKALRFAYETLLGRTLWPILFGGRFVSALMGRYYDSPRSHKVIAKLIAIPGCHPEEAEFPADHYTSFNDYFSRKLKPGVRPVANEPTAVVSPADGKLLVHTELSPSDPIPVKGARRSINDLCQTTLPDTPLTVAVIRLAPVDYHRYHFPCDCTQKEATQIIAGKYHSVNPIALLRHPDLFVENTRHITVLENPQCGIFRMIEVAAFGVGSIIRSAEGKHFSKMDEKGFFKFGGSTVILVFKAGKVTFDNDLITASANGMETAVKCGSRIAILKTDNMEG
ncbi:MAG: phosphatidylserine decarboxylase [Lentisphaeria bacterium]|nr:phosphatidylserine decarboxylase [Lentisphaeria bacterium]